MAQEELLEPYLTESVSKSGRYLIIHIHLALLYDEKGDQKKSSA